MSGKTPLFVTYGGGHATMMVPVVKALRDAGFDVPVLALTMGRKAFADAGQAFLGFRDLLREGDREALAHGERIAAAMHAEHTGIPLEESVAYLGLCYQDLVERHGAAEAARLFAEKGRMAFVPLGVMERVFDRFKPDVVVTTNSPRSELAARLVARRRGVPIVGMTDLLGTYAHPMDVDHLLVACRAAERAYRGAPEVKAKAVHVVGNPAMDGALRWAGPPDPEWRRRFPADRADAAYVVSAEQYSYIRRADRVFVRWTPEQIRANLDRVYAACRDSNAVLLVRPHPSLAPALYREWVAARPPCTAYMADREDLYPLLRSCDLVLSNLSTIMLDALYMNRPVLLVRYPDSMTLLPFDEMGFAFSAPLDDPGLLREAMRAALREPRHREAKAAAFRAEFPPLPCAPRIVEVLRSCLSL